MDGEDVFGCKIKVQCVDRPPCASPGPAHSRTPIGAASRMLPSNGSGSKPRKARRDGAGNSVHTCLASASNDSGVKLSSSDDSEGVAENSGLTSAPVDLIARPYDDRRVESTACSVPSDGDDIVVCGPVEEIDVDMEMPTKDVNTHDAVPSSTPSKKTKNKQSECASKTCKLAVSYSTCVY